MFKIKNINYSEAGSLLVGEYIKAYQLDSSYDVTEIKLSLDDLSIDGDLVTYDCVKLYYDPKWNYDLLKTNMIHKRYSNDDLIAIMLNKDDSEEDALAYEKMQEWREWSSQVARAIIEKRNNI